MESNNDTNLVIFGSVTLGITALSSFLIAEQVLHRARYSLTGEHSTLSISNISNNSDTLTIYFIGIITLIAIITHIAIFTKAILSSTVAVAIFGALVYSENHGFKFGIYSPIEQICSIKSTSCPEIYGGGYTALSAAAIFIFAIIIFETIIKTSVFFESGKHKEILKGINTKQENFKEAIKNNNLEDEEIYLKIHAEISENIFDEALKIKAIANANGDPNKTKSEYIKLRFKKLKSAPKALK